MKRIQSGNLAIHAADDKLLFEIGGDTPARAEVPVEDFSVIMEFIRAHKESLSNRRTGFRLDLGQLKTCDFAQIKVVVEAEGERIPVTPADLSITGIRVFSEELDGEPGLQATIHLGFEHTSVSLPAVLVRRYDDNTRFAFHFPEIFGDDGRLNPPSELTRILYALESLWLDQNLDLKWNLA